LRAVAAVVPLSAGQPAPAGQIGSRAGLVGGRIIEAREATRAWEKIDGGPG
jgi:hypothetical protein